MRRFAIIAVSMLIVPLAVCAPMASASGTGQIGDALTQSSKYAWFGHGKQQLGVKGKVAWHWNKRHKHRRLVVSGAFSATSPSGSPLPKICLKVKNFNNSKHFSKCLAGGKYTHGRASRWMAIPGSELDTNVFEYELYAKRPHKAKKTLFKGDFYAPAHQRKAVIRFMPVQGVD